MTDDARDHYKEEWEQVDEKTLLAQILGELSMIRTELQHLNQRGEDESQDLVPCQACQARVPEEERKQHAVEEHGAPKDIAEDELVMFNER